MPKTKVLNRILEIMTERGFATIRPSEKLLDDLHISLHMWNKWVRKYNDPELWQMRIIAEFLQCDITDLIEPKKVEA